MAKPPSTPPSSDIDGVHQDGMRPSKKLPTSGEDAEDLDQAGRKNAARPDTTDPNTADDRTS